jgi:glycerol transport system ATP-binding protein
VLPCEVKGGKVRFAGRALETIHHELPDGDGRFELGVRPEFVRFSPIGIPIDVVKISDAGRFRIVETRHAAGTIKLLVAESADIPEGRAQIAFDPAHTQVYRDGWAVG